MRDLRCLRSVDDMTDSEEGAAKEAEKSTNWVAIGIVLGLPIGAGMGLVLFDNVAIGAGIGISIGLCIGAALDAYGPQSAEASGGANTGKDPE